MGLKDILTWWSRRSDQEALEHEREAELAPGTRDTVNESFGDHKIDAAIHETRTGAETESASVGDLDDV